MPDIEVQKQANYPQSSARTPEGPWRPHTRSVSSPAYPQIQRLPADDESHDTGSNPGDDGLSSNAWSNSVWRGLAERRERQERQALPAHSDDSKYNQIEPSETARPCGHTAEQAEGSPPRACGGEGLHGRQTVSSTKPNRRRNSIPGWILASAKERAKQGAEQASIVA